MEGIGRHIAVTVRDGGPAQENATVIVSFNDGAAQRAAIVDAATGGLRGTVGGNGMNAQFAGGFEELGVRGGAANENGVEFAEGIDALERVHGLGELHGGQSRVHAVARGGELCRGLCEGGDVEAVAEIETERLDAGDERADEDLDSRDVVGGHGE